MNKRMIGSIYEDAAAAYLQSNGFVILERNYRNKIGEIDIVAKKNDKISFVEVKFRQNQSFGDAVEAVNDKKLRKIYKIAQWYLLEHPELQNFEVQIDALAITGNQIQHYENCYGGM
ncbi:MAG: YraN family protein [Eubacterium sp.]|nr:YraN family protein [Eubacterium sp.]